MAPATPVYARAVTLPTYVVVAAGAAPALAAMWYFDRLDRARPEPARLRHKVALFGALAVVPVIVLVTVMTGLIGSAAPADDSYAGAWYQAFVQAALPEEACKIAVVYWLVWRRPELDERLDGIIYATRAGLGFALVENVFYLLGQSDTQQMVVVWLLRAALAVPGHALWTGVIGYLAARRRFDRVGPGLIGGYLLAVALHGGYDVTLFLRVPVLRDGKDGLGGLLLLAALAMIVLSWILFRRMAKKALALDDDAAQARSAATAVAS